MSQVNGDESTYKGVRPSSHSSDSRIATSVPTLEVPERKIVAVDHPCMLLNLENGLKSFGPKPEFQKVSFTFMCKFCCL
jgi:hypothetical protein